MIRFGRAICGDLKQAERREWWLSNGRGAYAAGNIAGSLTRRYHGLLITPVNSSLDRQLLFSRAEASVEINGQRYDLGCNHWESGAIEPRGEQYIESFRLDGQLPVWVYSVGGVRLEQRIFMEQGEATVWLVFRCLESPVMTPVNISLSLWISRRDHHAQLASGAISPEISSLGLSHLQVTYDDDISLHLQLSDGELQLEHSWIDDLLLPDERERGLPDRDSHLAIATASISLKGNSWSGLRAGLKASMPLQPAVALEQQQQLQSNNLITARKVYPNSIPRWIAQLLISAKEFLFRRPLAGGGLGESVIAGYPWFADWGRDTMIALPGLTLATGKLPVARRILETWANYVDAGMIPNRFPESSDIDAAPEYNSVDASLWYVMAWHSYMEAGGEEGALLNVMPVLQQIIHAYRDGTRYQIHMDTDNGLLHIGDANSQLSWMDARAKGKAVTPRSGKPVEVNALWYNALCAMQRFCEKLGTDVNKSDANEHTANEHGTKKCDANLYADMAAKTRRGFQRFKRADGGLYDVLDTPTGDDDSIRPNQIFALSLPFPLLAKSAAETVFKEVREHLYTSYGLRSLSPQHAAYQGVYVGGVDERDASYHNGPVWGWLLGHYVMAHYRLYQKPSAALALLEPMRDHLYDAGLGSISEIFDGDAPHTPRGAPSQAWSVATVLEAWWLIKSQPEAKPELRSKSTSQSTSE